MRCSICACSMWRRNTGTPPEFKARVRSTAYQFGIEAAEVLKVHEVVLRDSVLKAGAPASE